MFASERDPQNSAQEALQLVELAETSAAASSLEEFAQAVLPKAARITNSSSAVLYLADSRLLRRRFFPHGWQPEAASRIESLCAEQFARFARQADLQPVSLPAAPDESCKSRLTLCPLRDGETCVGIIGLTPPEQIDLNSSDLWQRALRTLATTIARLAERAESERQLEHLNTYLTVSSMLAQYLGLHESLEIALYCCMDVVSAEAASVLLLDDEKQNFRFYHVEGPAKPVLATATFPADKGLAGHVLRTQQSEVINDVQHDPRFYGKIDSESGFQTRNMIVMPLTAGEEQIGVLEVLNRADGGPFTDEERLLVQSIAEEIAFAIRNAKVFEFVVNSYCKQRQGQTSCRGCKRPLGSWTPCVKYREAIE